MTFTAQRWYIAGVYPQERRLFEVNNIGRNLALWVIIALLLLTLFNVFKGQSPQNTVAPLAFSEFLDLVEKGQVRDVTIE